MTFADVLVIKNGRNQKSVEDPLGTFPIYGSGGIMGYANDFICQANTVIIGRKGNINKPIFVEEPFWNVDTAFGLEAKSDVLLPKYLYYFCCRYDFERLNKAVTIPSLTKADLLKIELDLPPLDAQAAIIDDLIKARFVEMFGDPEINPKGLPEKRLDSLADIVSGITKGRKAKTDELYEVPYMAVSNVKDGYIDWTTVKTIMATAGEIDQYRLLPDDVLMTEGGDPDKLGRGAIIHEPPQDCIHQNHIFRVRLKKDVLLSVYMAQTEDPRVVYADIIDHPHHQSETRPHMSLYDRAAQFSAFDALAGYSDMIAEEARLTDSKILLDDNEIEALNQKLCLIAEAIDNGQHPTVTFTVFVQDPLKTGGKYEEITETVKKIDMVEQKVILEKQSEKSGVNVVIAFGSVISIRGELFEGPS